MADPNVKLTFTGNSEDAEKAIARLEQRYLALQNKISQAGKKGKDAAQSGNEGLAKWATSLGQAAAGYASVGAAIGSVVSEMKKLRQEQDAASLSQEKQIKKLQVQGNLSKVQGAEAQERVYRAAQSAAVPTAYATTGAAALISSGFSVKDATGEAGLTLLQGIQANDLKGEDPAEIALSAAQFLQATGKDKNAAELRSLFVDIQRLSAESPITVGDLNQLAGKSSGLSSLVSNDEILAGFDVLRGLKGADTASTGLKTVGERLSGAAGDKEREAQLKKLGLTAGDVDFVGEDMQTVLNRLGEGFEKLPEELRAGVRQRLFGSESADAAKALIDNRAQFGERVALLSNPDESGFNKAVDESTSGTEAAQIRTQNIKDQRLASEGDKTTITMDAHEEAARRSVTGDKLGETQVSWRRWLADGFSYMGMNSRAAGEVITAGTGADGEKLAESLAAPGSATMDTLDEMDAPRLKRERMRKGLFELGREVDPAGSAGRMARFDGAWSPLGQADFAFSEMTNLRGGAARAAQADGTVSKAEQDQLTRMDAMITELKGMRTELGKAKPGNPNAGRE